MQRPLRDANLEEGGDELGAHSVRRNKHGTSTGCEPTRLVFGYATNRQLFLLSWPLR
jgi:hypothetical protein